MLWATSRRTCSRVREAVSLRGDGRAADGAMVGATTLRLYSTVAAFGTPRDVAASELAIETFLPADDATRRWLVEANA